MNRPMLTQHDLAIKGGQFVAPTVDAQYAAEYEAGRKAFYSKRRSWCSTDAMREGWDAAAEQGRQQFARAMLAQEAM
jgi:hypothetical protein